MKTSELNELALDWAVAVAKKDDIGWAMGPHYPIDLSPLPHAPSRGFQPSKNWGQAGPIVEQNLIEVSPRFQAAGYETPTGEWRWVACVLGSNNVEENYESEGPTPLIAAMRCFVASKLGPEVDVPEEVLQAMNEVPVQLQRRERAAP